MNACRMNAFGEKTSGVGKAKYTRAEPAGSDTNIKSDVDCLLKD
jgi:hypothetical protein